MTIANGKSKLFLHWFRHGDLRLHDNPALVHSAKSGNLCLPVFCFDKRVFGNVRTTFGALKVGPRRAKFLTECVADLREQLNGIGSRMVVGHETPGVFFDSLLSKIGKDYQVSIVCQEEVCKEERDAVKEVLAVLQKHQPTAKLETVWGSTMYDLKDLPYEDGLQDMPNTFTPFRNKVEKRSHIQKPLPTPRNELTLPAPDTALYKAVESSFGSVPTLEDLGYTKEQIQEANTVDRRGVMEFRGGESVALARMKDYIWDKDLLRVYFETRNGMLGADYSSKFSPWLAHGCLSPRLVAAECQKYEEQRLANKSTYWLVFELLWRDFCKFFAVKHGDAIFFPGGTIGKDRQWSTFEKNFEAWKDGRTGYPLVDANMRELKVTGFMSNRGRQNVCSFLALDLNHDWRLGNCAMLLEWRWFFANDSWLVFSGGDWFESHLLDYDVYSNWVVRGMDSALKIPTETIVSLVSQNWCSGAGMTGGRLNRFNIVKQSKDYDQNGDYVRHWLPELMDVPKQFVHEPWKMNQFQQMEFNCKLGVDYPNPIIPPCYPNHTDRHDKSNGQTNNGKQRKPNNSNHNKHQKYEMKSLKQGGYEIK